MIRHPYVKNRIAVYNKPKTGFIYKVRVSHNTASESVTIST